jgi:hypothetical protein
VIGRASIPLLLGNMGVLPACLCCATALAEEPQVTPYRPTVSNPAALSAPGWLELELGWLGSKGGDVRREDSVPYLLKYAFDEDWGLLLGGSLYVRSVNFSGSIEDGYGNTSFTLKHRMPAGNAEFGVELTVNAPAGSLGGSKPDYVLNGIYSTGLGPWQLDFNIGATRIGDPDPGAGRVQAAWAAACSRPINDKWGWALEVSGAAQHRTSSKQQILTAATYSVSRRMVLDFGFALGLDAAAPDQQLFAGATMLLGQLGPARQ